MSTIIEITGKLSIDKNGLIRKSSTEHNLQRYGIIEYAHSNMHNGTIGKYEKSELKVQNPWEEILILTAFAFRSTPHDSWGLVKLK